MILKLGIKHQAMELYKVCINHDPGMIWPILRQGQYRSPMHLNGGKLLKYDFRGKTCRIWADRQNIYVYEKNCPQVVVCPCPGAIYMYMTKIFKYLVSGNSWANQSQTLYGASLGRGNEMLYKWSRSHDQDGCHGYK